MLIDTVVDGMDGIGRATNNVLARLSGVREFEIGVLARVARPAFKTYIDSTKHYTVDEVERKAESTKQFRASIFHALDYRIPIDSEVKVVSTIHDIFRHTRPTLCYTDEVFLQRYGEAAFSDIAEVIRRLEQRGLARAESYYSRHHQYYSLYLRWALLQSCAIVVPSAHVRNEIKIAFPGTENIHVLYWGIDHANTFSGGGLRPLITNKYVLYVGQDRPHKNVDSVIRGFALARRFKLDLKLMLVGRDFDANSRIYESLIPMKLAESVVLAGPVSDQQLRQLYQSSRGLIHLSSDEGFGFTPLEAFRQGAPVVAARVNKVLREVLGDLAIYIDHTKDEQIAKAIIALCDGDKSGLGAARIERAQEFNWHKYTQQLMKIWRSIA